MSGCTRRHPLRGRCRGYLVLAGLGLLLLSPGARYAAGAQRPVVYVVFEARTHQFLELTDPGLGAWAAEEIRQRCAKEWPFIAWSAASEAPPNAEWVWEAKLRAEPGVVEGVSRDWRVLLRHYMKRANPVSLSEIETNKPQLYDLGEMKTLDVQGHKEKLAKLIGDQFNSELLGRVRDQFISEIPIGNRIVVDPEEQCVVVPLRLSDLQAKGQSQLKVTFVRSNSASIIKDGYLYLKPLMAIREGVYKDYIYGTVLELVSPPDSTLRDVNSDPRLVGILGPGSASDFHVYMFTYIRDPAAGAPTSEGLILEPDTNGGGQ